MAWVRGFGYAAGPSVFLWAIGFAGCWALGVLPFFLLVTTFAVWVVSFVRLDAAATSTDPWEMRDAAWGCLFWSCVLFVALMAVL